MSDLEKKEPIKEKSDSDEEKKKVKKEDKEEDKTEKNFVNEDLTATNKALQQQVKSLIAELDGIKTENEGLKARITEQNSVIEKYTVLERNSIVDKIKAIDSKFEDNSSLDKGGLEIILNSLERTAAVLTTKKIDHSELKKEVPKTEFIKEENSVNKFDTNKSITTQDFFSAGWL